MFFFYIFLLTTVLDDAADCPKKKVPGDETVAQFRFSPGKLEKASSGAPNRAVRNPLPEPLE